MNAKSQPGERTLHVELAQRVDRACTAFEAAWKAGQRPRIEAYLPAGPQAERAALLRELVPLEAEYRRRAGEDPPPAEYARRFPDLDPAWLAAALATPPGETGPERSPAPKGSTGPGRGKAERVSPGPRLFGDYELLKQLGKGGMGVVYLARQRSADRLVALKLIRLDRLEHLTAEQRREWLDRFRTEGRATARVADARVVTVYEVGALGGRPFYSMRYVEGRSLAEVLKKGPLPNHRAAALMKQVARAVQAVHDEGVLHRDLKPHNILVDAQGRPYVTDFGLAKWLDAAEGVTHTGDVLGSPPYMSPEQAQDAAHVSAATDVYGLGATLYAVLTGRPPFQGTTVAETLHQVKYREPVPPRRVNPAVPRDLNTIALKCLEKEPGRRFRSAAEVADELQLYLEGRPIRTRPVGPTGRLWRWSRRNPVVAALSAAALILISLAGAAYWNYRSTAASAAIAKKEADAHDAEARWAHDEESYLEDMPRAGKHYDAGELGKVRELLAQWRPGAGETDHRGWEWYLLDALCKEARFSVRGHQGPVQAVAWAADGDRLASADGQGIVKVWSVPDAKEMVPAMQARGGRVYALGWSPDGKLLATATEKVLQLWETATGKEQRTVPLAADINHPIAIPPKAGESPVSRQVFLGAWTRSLTWSPSGEKLALADADGKVQIWDVGTDKDGLVLNAHQGGVHSAAWSPDGTRLASVGGDGLVKVWDTVSGKEVFPPVGMDDRFAGMVNSYALAWTEDGKRLNIAVSGVDEIRVLDVGSRAVAASRKLIPRDPWVRVGVEAARSKRFIWGPGGKLLASIETVSGDVKTWDAATGQEGPSVRVGGNPRPMMLPSAECSPAWDRSGRRLALGENDGMIQIWRVSSSRRPIRSPVRNALAWSADSRHVLGPPDQEEEAADRMKAMQEQAQQQREIFRQRPSGGLTAPDPNMLKDRARPEEKAQHLIQASDAITGEVTRRLGNGKQDALPNVLAESPDGKWLAIATPAGLLQLWPAAPGAQAFSLEEPPRDGASNNPVLLAWSPDSKRLAASVPRGLTIRIWDPATRKPVLNLPGHGKPLRSLTWSPDGKHLASAGDDGTVHVWDVLSGKETSALPYFVKHQPDGGRVTSRAISMLAWSRDGRRLAVAGEDGTIRIMDVDERKEVVTLRGRGLTKDIHYVVAWSPDGKRLAAGGPDGTILWDAATWKEVLTLPAPGGGGTLAWSPDGWQLGSFGGGSVTIWDGTPED